MTTTRTRSRRAWRRRRGPAVQRRAGAGPSTPVGQGTPVTPVGQGTPVAPVAARARMPQGVTVPPAPPSTARVPQEPPASPVTDTQLQVNALQALCRQAFGFRLAMIAVAAPSALLNAGPGWGVRLVGIAVVVTFMVSYALFRDWERFGPLLLRHPTLLAADTLFGALLLVSAGPDTTLAYVSVCTPLLAGLIYGWRGAAVFASLQGVILLLVHATLDNPHTAPAETLILPGLCVIAGAVGSSLRKLMLHLGEATRALAAVRARLAVTEAVDAERARLAREMHDSVAKTLHGVALAADGLACSAGAARMDPALVRRQAELVARSARRAAAESRELLADLRREGEPGREVDVLAELACAVRAFRARSGAPVTYARTGEERAFSVPPAVARQLLSITEEAMENAHRHARATRVEVRAGVRCGVLTVGVRDDGRGLPGLPAAPDLDRLRRSGHFGLVGMAERAASVGARISFGRGERGRGTEVRVEWPLALRRTEAGHDR
ncbi:histidine kinase [Streptomyces althioticus]|uniref:sensor histidine kinase n=1 Tax=Streptomyces althioticus TaxID=83380 RepID=UPI0038731DA5|nr:histidine kinase [Streptomyces althioticus]